MLHAKCFLSSAVRIWNVTNKLCHRFTITSPTLWVTCSLFNVKCSFNCFHVFQISYTKSVIACLCDGTCHMSGTIWVCVTCQMLNAMDHMLCFLYYVDGFSVFTTYIIFQVVLFFSQSIHLSSPTRDLARTSPRVEDAPRQLGTSRRDGSPVAPTRPTQRRHVRSRTSRRTVVPIHSGIDDVNMLGGAANVVTPSSDQRWSSPCHHPYCVGLQGSGPCQSLQSEAAC